MFDQNALKKAKIDLFNIVSNLAMTDYKQRNFKNDKRISIKHIPYGLSFDTEKAQEHYNMVYGKEPEDITPEQEEQIKDYLLGIRINRRELLTEGYKGGNWYYNN